MDGAITCKITDVQHFSSKVTCFSKLGAIKVIADKLSDVQLEMFSRSCFGKLFKMNELKFAGQLVHNLLLRQVECDDSDELWFALPNDTVIRFSMQEFGLITGLDCGPYPKDFATEECTTAEAFSRKMFNGSNKVSNKILDAAFRSASSDNDDDIFKLALLYFLEMVLLGKDPKNHIRREHILLLDDMNAFNQYPWGRCCYEMTLSGMKKDFKKMAKNVGKRNKGHNNKADSAFYSLSGFPYAFQIWACEAIPLIAQHIALKSSNMLPRIVSWSSIGIPKTGEIVTLLHRSDLEAHQTLEATAAEEKEEYCKYFVREEDRPLEGCSDRGSVGAFLKLQPIGRGPSAQAAKDSSKAASGQQKGIAKQLQQFQQETRKTQRHTNNKLEETMQLLEETKKKVDNIMDFLLRSSTVPTEQQPPAAKDKDEVRAETNEDSSGLQGELPVLDDMYGDGLHHREVDSVGLKQPVNPVMPPSDVWQASPSIGSDASVKIIPETELDEHRREKVLDTRFSHQSKGSAEVTHAAVETSRRKITFDPATTTVTHMQPTVGSPSIGSDVSMKIIPKYKFVKRKRKKGPQISSPFEEIEVGTRKRTKFEPFRKPSASELVAFKAWRDEHVPNELPTIRLPTGDCNRQWFRDLSKADVWLSDSHMDAAFCFIRWKAMRCRSSKMEAFTTTDILFGQRLQSKWEAYTKKKPLWEDDDMCIRYARGEVSSSRNDSTEVACRPWTGLTTLYMPLNYRGVHWVLVKVHFTERTITLYDSLGTYVRNYKQFLQPIQTLLPQLLEKTDHYQTDSRMTAAWYRKEGWTVSRCADTPQQESGSGDCGMFVIKLAEHMANGMAVNSFNKFDIGPFREQLAVDIWNWSRQLHGG